MGVYQRHVQPRLRDAVLRGSAVRDVRRRVCSDLRGDVVEIGYGSGLNHAHLPSAVTGVWAVEPSTVALRLGERRRGASSPPVVVAGEDAQHMLLPDDRFDAALSTWTLCGIPEPGAALSELVRVLKPGGTLHFVEHGQAPEASVARWQRRGNAINRRIAGCLLDRDIASLLAASGFTVTELDTYYEKGAPKPVGWTFEGRATAS